MRITVFGATGATGGRVVEEALSRGHEVTAVSRRAPRHPIGNPVPVPAVASPRESSLSTSATVVRGDASDPADVARLAVGQDVVISATRPVPGHEHELALAAKGLVSGLAGSGVRLLVVGGAASLTLPGSPGTTVVDGPGFPDEVRPIALACNEQLEVIRAATDLDWVYLSPAAVLEPGIRTGRYRLGKDELLTDAAGNSFISMEDLAVALLDEAEQPRHHRTRFTVGY